jgi:hypothetical protein
MKERRLKNVSLLNQKQLILINLFILRPVGSNTLNRSNISRITTVMHIVRLNLV